MDINVEVAIDVLVNNPVVSVEVSVSLLALTFLVEWIKRGGPKG
jgi:hypothetical protein